VTGRLTPAVLRAVVVALVVALVASVVLLVLSWRRADHEHALREAGRSADAAARRIAVELTTYDYRTIAHAYDWADEDGTSRFRRQFASVSADARASVVALKVVATGEVVASAPDVEDTGHVRVLLFGDQRVRSTNSDGTRTEEPRLSMQMVRQDGRWLVDAVEMENSLS
jgi:Mce-associated membrane protein